MAELISTLGVKLDASGVKKGARQVEKSVDGMSRNVRSQNAKMQGSFSKLKNSIFSIKGALVGIGGALIFKATISQAVEFETAMKEVATLLSGDAKTAIDGMTDSVRELSAEFGSSRIEQAKGLYQAISAGAEAGAEAIEVLTAANKLAVGGVTDVETAVDGLTTAMNVYGATGLTATEASDALFVAMKAGKTTVGELSSSLGKVIPLAVSAGLSFDESAAAVAALTKAGISTRESVTGLRAILAAVAKPSSEAAELAEQLGINFSVTGLKAKGFADFMAEVSEKTGGSTEQIAKLFGGVEAIIPALNFAGEAGKSFTQIMEDMDKKAGATQEAFDIMSKTASFAFGRLKQAIGGAFEALGAEALPAVTAFAEVLLSLSDVIRDNTKLIITLAKIMGAGGILYAALAAAPVIVGAASAAWVLLNTELTLASVKALLASTNFGFLTLSLKASSAATLDAVKSFGLLKTAFAGLFAVFVGFQIGTYFREEFVEVRVFGLDLVRTLLKAFARLKLGFQVAGDVLQEAFGGPIDFLRNRWADFFDALETGLRALNFDTLADRLGALSEVARVTGDDTRTLAEKTEENVAAFNAATLEIDKHIDAQIEWENTMDGVTEKVKEQADTTKEDLADAIETATEKTVEATVRNADFTDAITDLIAALKEENETIGLSDKALLQRTLDLNMATDAEREHVLALYDSVTAQKANIDAMKEAKTAQEKLMADGKQLTEDLLTPLEELNKGLDHNQTLYEAGSLSAVNLARANAKVNEEYKKITETTKETDTTMKDLGATFSSAFEDAIIKGNDFRSVLDGIFEDIQRIILRKSITDPIAKAVSGFDFGGFLGGLFGGGSDPVSSFASGVLGGGGLTSTGTGGIGFGLASGGSVKIGGTSGVDKNMLQVNNQPVARVSKGETISVGPEQKGSTTNNIVFNISTQDADSFAKSQSQIFAKAQSSLLRANKRNN
jgi:TP901 family phage tail tape measure protein